MIDRRHFIATLSVLGISRVAVAAPLDDALADIAKARSKLTTLQGPLSLIHI